MMSVVTYPGIYTNRQMSQKQSTGYVRLKIWNKPTDDVAEFILLGQRGVICKHTIVIRRFDIIPLATY